MTGDPPAPDPGAAGQTGLPRKEKSTYPRRPARRGRSTRAEHNRVLRPALTEPDTAPMTEEQHRQAVSAMSALILTWLQRRAHEHHTSDPA